MKVHYEEFQPSAVLSQLVDLYWFSSFEGGPSEVSPLQYCLPDGMVELIVHLGEHKSREIVNGQKVEFPESLLVGIMEKPVIWEAPGGASLFGIRFKPEGIANLMRSPISELANTFIDANLIMDKQASSIIQNLKEAQSNQHRIFYMEAFLQNQLSRHQSRPNCFSAAVHLIRNGEPGYSITDLSKAVCISERQLQRVFKENMGIGPKSYSRIIRFRKIKQFLQTNPKVSWVDIAYDFGYADQAHFIRDFKAFSGRTPGVVLAN